jgi:hypothetical protein
MTYDDWTPEDDEADARAFERRLLGRKPYWVSLSRQKVLDDYYEAEKADADMGREGDDD